MPKILIRPVSSFEPKNLLFCVSLHAKSFRNFSSTGLWNFPYMLERNFYCEIHLLPETRRYYTVVSSGAHYLLTFTIVSVLYTAIYIRLKSR